MLRILSEAEEVISNHENCDIRQEKASERRAMLPPELWLPRGRIYFSIDAKAGGSSWQAKIS